jgi:CHAD domain-containing protein
MKGFSITNSESVSINIHRILLGQFHYIIQQSEMDREEVHKSIHETRKSMKRIRAFLRMIRDEIGYSSYYRENVFYRDLSRQLSDIRNFEVLAGSIRDLKEDLSSTLSSDVFSSLEEELDIQRNRVMPGKAALNQLLKEVAREVAAARERIYDFPIRHNDFRAFEGGLFRMYRQGRRYLKQARRDPSPTLLHDLRKRMKYFWHQVEILQPIYPGPLKAYAATLEKITENLGTYNDLQILQEFITESDIPSDPVIQETLQEACRAKQTMLLHDLWPRADMAYSEQPEAMVARLGSYWRIYFRTNPEPLNVFSHER